MTGTKETTRIRVVFVLPSFAGGGAERVVLTFANALPRDRFQVALVVLNGDGPLRSLVEPHVRVHVLGVPRISRALPRLLSLLRRMGAHVVVASAPSVNVSLLVARWLLPSSTRVMVREANLPSLRLPTMHPRMVFVAGYRWLYPRADLVLATSERMRQELISRGSSEQCVVVLPNPVDVAHIRLAAAVPARRSGAGRRFVAVGRLVPEKGFDRLLEVLAGVSQHDHCLILGEGAQREVLQSLVGEQSLDGRVELYGFSDNPWMWMAGADALLMPSRTEGMPNAALESLACGTPVLATPESGGIAEIASQAPDGAVAVLPFEDFSHYLNTMQLSPPSEVRPSLLPDRYRLEEAVDALATAIQTVVGEGQADARTPGAVR